MQNPSLIGDDLCEGGEYDTEECGWDGGDCVIHRQRFPNCTATQPYLIGNGQCNWHLDSAECDWDGGDCEDFKALYPGCRVPETKWIGDGLCDHDYNTEVCGWDGGDCSANADFPNCTQHLNWYGNDRCDLLLYNVECGWDAGDCGKSPSYCCVKITRHRCFLILQSSKDSFKSKYPDCEVNEVLWVGDGECDGGEYNTIECGWDGGDCL